MTTSSQSFYKRRRSKGVFGDALYMFEVKNMTNNLSFSYSTFLFSTFWLFFF